MKILLRKDVRKVGKKNEIKEVSDGYAKNFLIARGLAIPATETRIKEARARSEDEAKKLEEKKSLIGALAKELEGHPLEFKMKTGKKGELYAAIGEKEIGAELKKKGLDIGVHLEKPLKTLGDHHAELDLGFGTKTKISVRIVAED